MLGWLAWSGGVGALVLVGVPFVLPVMLWWGWQVWRPIGREHVIGVSEEEWLHTGPAAPHESFTPDAQPPSRW